jgi:hypothetical protein
MGLVCGEGGVTHLGGGRVGVVNARAGCVPGLSGLLVCMVSAAGAGVGVEVRQARGSACSQRVMMF